MSLCTKEQIAGALAIGARCDQPLLEVIAWVALALIIVITCASLVKSS